jgi:hypothetical protein
MAIATKSICNRENDNTLTVTYDTEVAVEILRNQRDGEYMKSMGMRVFDTEKNMQKFASRFSSNGSQIRMATAKQINYMHDLKIVVPENCTLDRASQLIDAAKRGELGSAYGFYEDGSN